MVKAADIAVGATTIEAIRAETLLEVAAFLRTQVDLSSRYQTELSDPLYTWLLHRLAHNPVQIQDGTLGHALRAEDGRIAGVNLVSPGSFALNGQILVGLVSGSFFVDRNVRMLGFLLFKRFLAMSGVNFWYATSSNENSGPLWQHVRAEAVPDSDRELILPVDFGVLAEEKLMRRGYPLLAAQLFRSIGVLSPLFSAFDRTPRGQSHSFHRLGQTRLPCRATP